MEGVAAKKAKLDRFNELAMNYSDETAEEMARLQDEIGTIEAAVGQVAGFRESVRQAQRDVIRHLDALADAATSAQVQLAGALLQAGDPERALSYARDAREGDVTLAENARVADSLAESPASAVVTLACFCVLGWYLYRGARGAARD
mgnify:CR=1 FL=1